MWKIVNHSSWIMWNQHVRLHILLVCAQNLTSWHVTDFLPTCYFSIHIHPHMFSHCPLHESQCHLLSILCIPLQYTHVCASLLEVDRGRGGHVFGLRLEFKLSSLNWTAFLEAFCGNGPSLQDKIDPQKCRKLSFAHATSINLKLTYKKWI